MYDCSLACVLASVRSQSPLPGRSMKTHNKLLKRT